MVIIINERFTILKKHFKISFKIFGPTWENNPTMGSHYCSNGYCRESTGLSSTNVNFIHRRRFFRVNLHHCFHWNGSHCGVRGDNILSPHSSRVKGWGGQSNFSARHTICCSCRIDDAELKQINKLKRHRFHLGKEMSHGYELDDS